MTEGEPTKAPWEEAADKALAEGDASHFTPETIKLIVAKQAMDAGTPGAQVSASKVLAQIEAMLIQVTKDESDKRTDDQLADSLAKDLAPILGIDKDAIKKAYLAHQNGDYEPVQASSLTG